jgi:hypothetical protein
VVKSQALAQNAPVSAPQIGQVSKDSVWVPTPERMIRRMLQLADLTPNDVLIDLGSGDGRIPIHAARHFGARAIGVELEENLIALSVQAAKAQGVSHLVSHHFTLEDWQPDETVQSEQRTGYLWIVPADAAGAWDVAGTENDTLRLEIRQKHQVLTIRGERAGRPVNVIGARLRGTEISFTSFDPDGHARHYVGRVSPEGRMQGESSGLEIPPRRWSATRGP